MKKYPSDNKYLVSEDGKVWDTLKSAYKVTTVTDQGYLTITSGAKKLRLHRIVCETYHSNPDEKREVNHKDGDKKNNHKDNLEWCTSLENKAHGWATGLYKDIRQEHWNANLKDYQVHSICRDLEQGFRNIDIAKKHNICKDRVAHIRKGYSWKSISCQYSILRNKHQTKSTETVLRVCRHLEDGCTNREINSLIPSVSASDVNRIRNGDIFRDLSSNFNIPKSRFSSISEATVVSVCELLVKGYMNKSIAEELKISVSIVSKIKRGLTWKHISSNYNW